MKNKFFFILILLSTNFLSAQLLDTVVPEDQCRIYFEKSILKTIRSPQNRKIKRLYPLMPRRELWQDSLGRNLLNTTYEKPVIFIALYAEVDGQKYLLLGNEIGKHERLSKKLSIHLSKPVAKQNFLYGGEIKIHKGVIDDLNVTTSFLKETTDAKYLLDAIKEHRIELLNPKNEKFFKPELAKQLEFDPANKHLSEKSFKYSSIRHTLSNKYFAIFGQLDLIKEEIGDMRKSWKEVSTIVEDYILPLFNKIISDDKNSTHKFFQDKDVEAIQSFIASVKNQDNKLFDLPQAEITRVIDDIYKKAEDSAKVFKEKMNLESMDFPFQIIRIN